MATYGASTQSVSSRQNGLAISGFVCSLVGLFLLNVILGPLGIIFGGIGLSRANDGAPHRGLAIAGIVIGVIDVALFVVIVLALSHHGGRVYWRL